MENPVPVKIYEILKEVVDGRIENFAISVHDPNKKGEGYLGQMFFISLKNKENGKELNVVVKQAFSEKNIREYYPIREVFLNEIYFYTKLCPKFLEYQKRIPTNLHFENFPKCLASISEENFEALVLENLKYDGFVIKEKKYPLDRENFEFIFKVYGRLHAISFAYKALNPEEYFEVTKKMTDTWRMFSTLKSFEEAIELGIRQSVDSLQSKLDEDIVEKLRYYMDHGVELFQKSLEVSKYNCVIHGDCWSNNMMFKYDAGKLIDLKLVDFQMARLGSPVCDLSYCLYSGGTKEIFDDLDHLLQIYHNSLSENLKAYGCDPDELCPLDALKNDWKAHCQLGVIMGLMIWRMKLTFDEDAIDLSDLSDDQDMQKFFDAKYDKKTFQERTGDIVLHLYEKGFLY